MITREKFIQAVKAFEVQYGNLEHCLDMPVEPVPSRVNDEHYEAAHDKWKEENAKYENLTKRFFSNPVIHAYLTRKNIRFEDNHPLLVDAKEPSERDTTDYYELHIYRLFRELIVWRNDDVATREFAEQGGNLTAHRNAFWYLLRQNEKNARTKIHSPQDIYDIALEGQVRDTRAMLTGGAPKGSAWFHLYPNWKTEHATSVVSIVDPKSGRVLLYLFINSRSNEAYDEYMVSRLLECRPFRASSELDDLHPLHSKKPTLLDKYLMKTFRVDQKTLSEEQWRSEATDVSYARFDGNDYWIRYERENIPFISAPFELQKSDRDCTLYGLNFLLAISDMLDEPNMDDRVLKLARQVVEDVPGAKKALIEIFNNYLKKHLPMYFDPATGKQKSAEEIMSYHLQQRWDIGSTSLDLAHPVSTQVSGPSFFAEQESKKGADKKGPDLDPSSCTIS